jgi:prevent-host-death family protein
MKIGGSIMPTIRPSSDLRNKYSEISDFCHEYMEPIYITKNGKGDLAVLSIEAYERLIGKYELRKLLLEGLKDEEEGRMIEFEEAFRKLREL